MTKDPQAWNKNKLKRAIDLIDQVTGKRVDGLDVDLTRLVVNIQQRARDIEQRMAGDRRTKIQRERDASQALTPKPGASGAAGLPAVKPVARVEPLWQTCERCVYPGACGAMRRCLAPPPKLAKTERSDTI